MTITSFAPDTRIENWLRSQEVTFTGPTPVRLNDFDVKSSKNNQARDVALVDDAVDAYHQSLKLGDTLPALIVFKRGTKYIIIDGNNRLAAATKFGADRVMCYVVSSDLDSNALMMLTLSANATNGQPVTRAWRLRQAVSLVANGYSKEITARHLKLPVSAIDGFEKARTADARARKLRVQGWEDISTSAREAIARIKLDPVMVMVAETVIGSGVAATAEFKAFTASLNRMASEDDQIAAVQLWARGEREAAAQRRRLGRVRNMSNPKQSIVSGLGKVQAFDLNNLHTIFASEFDRETLSTKTREAIAKLLAIQYRLHDRNNVDDWFMELVTQARG